MVYIFIIDTIFKSNSLDRGRSVQFRRTPLCDHTHLMLDGFRLHGELVRHIFHSRALEAGVVRLSRHRVPDVNVRSRLSLVGVEDG